MDITIATPDLVEKMADALRRENESADWFLECAQAASGQNGVTVCALVDGQVVGYGSLVFTASYPPFVPDRIPEITSLVVLPSSRRRGTGRQVLRTLEHEAKKAGYDKIGLGVGITTDYQAALGLYIREGYLPDGLGLYHYDLSGRPITYGDTITIDSSTSLWFVKTLG